MTHSDDDTQEPDRKKRAPGDEGAAYTKLIMDEVKRQRTALDWSAERLAEEMTKVGVPWTRDMVVNLETGRRKHIGVHEVLALAVVLGVSPLALLIPAGDGDGAARIPVTPDVLMLSGVVRDWFSGKTVPLGAWLDTFRATLSAQVGAIRDQVRKGVITEEMGEKLIAAMIDSSPVVFSRPADG